MKMKKPKKNKKPSKEWEEGYKLGYRDGREDTLLKIMIYLENRDGIR